MVIQIEKDETATTNTMEITLRGDPLKLSHALANGLPKELLVEILDALNAELAKRQA